MILIESSQPVHSVRLTCHPTPQSLLFLNHGPVAPFQELAVDFCSYAGREFLIVVDCFTDWPDIVYMGSNTTTPRLIAALKASFCRSGAPDIVWSDQGPQLTSKLFRDFAKEWGFKHVMSTPTYPQSNGKVEATVKSMKKLIEASWVRSSLDEGRLARALLQYRNTPETIYLQHKNFLAVPFRTRCQHTTGRSHQSGRGVLRKRRQLLHPTWPIPRIPTTCMRGSCLR